MTTEQDTMRADFEAAVSAPPFERSTLRFPNDPARFAWPGNYRDIAVDLAWHMFQAGRAAALQAPKAKDAVPGGWKLVPVEPTQAMVHAGIHAKGANTVDVWRAMLAAAPACGNGCDCLAQCGDVYAHAAATEREK